MKKFAIIGNPVRWSLSPVLFKQIFEELGIDAEYKAIETHAGDFEDIDIFFRRHQLNGANVTMPFKTQLLENVRLSDAAAARAAINVLHKTENGILGYNTDGNGAIAAFTNEGIAINGNQFLIIGGGATARTLCVSLCAENAARITITARNQRRLDELQRFLQQHEFNQGTQIQKIDGPEALTEKAIFVNCTPMGMPNLPAESPVNAFQVMQANAGMDLVYRPVITPFMRLLKAMGVQAIPGIDMFIFQAIASFGHWFGTDLAKQLDFQKLKDFLLNSMADNN